MAYALSGFFLKPKNCMRYFVKLSYTGTNYHGWQIQPNAETVQEFTENAFSTILQEKIKLTGAGRTDAGVHASEFYAHFDYSEKIGDTEKLRFRLNRFLPNDIAVHKIFSVENDLHSRFSAQWREYEYYLHFEKNPFLQNRSYFIYGDIDFEIMQKAANLLFDYTDFTSFSKLHTDTKTNNCKIMKARWVPLADKQFKFVIRADRFLRNMVRAITGSLLDVGRAKTSVRGFAKIIESQNRSEAGFSVPAHGLYLSKIKYPDF